MKFNNIPSRRDSMPTTTGSELDTGFASRLRTLIGGEKPYAWAARVGLSKGVFTGIWRTGSTPRPKTLEKIRAATGVSIDWLLRGEGAPFPADAPLRTESNCESPSAQCATQAYRTRVDDFLANGGFEVDYLSFKAEWARLELGVEPRHLALIRAVGDSMEPTLRAGDLLLVDRHVTEAGQDAIYAFTTDGKMQIKRIQRRPEGGLVGKSDNPLYRDQALDTGQAAALRIVGRVVWAGKRM